MTGTSVTSRDIGLRSINGASSLSRMASSQDSKQGLFICLSVDHVRSNINPF